MKIRFAATRTAAILGSGLALGGATYAIAQDPGGGLGVTVPAGTITAYGGTGAPTGWLLANGAEVSRLEHPELFAAIGTAYGAGNGSTTFNLPDLRGRVAVGRGTNTQVDTLGKSDQLAVGDRRITHRHGAGTLNVTSSGAHSHSLQTFNPHNRYNDFGKTRFGNATDWEGNGSASIGPSGGHTHPNSAFAGEVGDTTGPSNGPAYITINYIIKG